MSLKNLTKKEALELITPVVDNEVDENTRIAFFAYLEQDESVRQQYESIKRLKNVVSKRCPCADAPDRLRNRVHRFLEDQRTRAGASGEIEDNTVADPVYDVPSSHSVTDRNDESTGRQDTAGFWKYAAAAVLLVAAVIFGFTMYMNSPTEIYNVEEYAYVHFIKNEGRMVQPTIATASPANAELELAHAFNTPVTVPPLQNAELKGVVYSDFVPGFKTPMMEYYLPSEDQYIYIFAFKIDQLQKFEALERSEEAIRSCIKAEDFHIRDVNGKHVVSWKWDDTWYAAISNHDGKTLASLVEPLGYDNR
ncbi:MAG: hypothetical protein R3281_05390 [Balneolaceae bacterium]|nr:hypothetical protein [Balneolaceae bacterium]